MYHFTFIIYRINKNWDKLNDIKNCKEHQKTQQGKEFHQDI